MQDTGANLLASLLNRVRAGRWITVLLTSLICLLLGACHKAQQQTAANRKTEPVLSASPNPVPTNDFDQPLGITRITWNTGSQMIGDLYVKVNRSTEVFLARGSAGSFDVKWIQFDSLYEFRLYAKKHSRLLARVEVTRDD
jgi:hypothetical protein